MGFDGGCRISNEREVPDTLFHYTSLEALACILHNRTLRLMPLSGLDDPQESRTVDAPGIGMFHFVSCWTDDEIESIPMWNMYASLGSGVRIELINDPFKRYEYTVCDFEKAINMMPGYVQLEGSTISSFLPFEDIVASGYSVALFEGNDVLRRVIYTSDSGKLVPKMIRACAGETHVDLNMVARYKNEYWAFQREWRYVLSFLPMNPFHIGNDIEAQFAEAVGKMITGANVQPMPFYDLRLTEDAIRAMRIVPSPKMTYGNRILLDHLLAAYGLESNVEDSSLLGLL